MLDGQRILNVILGPFLILSDGSKSRTNRGKEEDLESYFKIVFNLECSMDALNSL
jgi:hypothetical protein